MSNIKETISINHPAGVCTLAEIQSDVDAFKAEISDPNEFGFTTHTVQALIDKIVELLLEKQHLVPIESVDFFSDSGGHYCYPTDIHHKDEGFVETIKCIKTTDPISDDYASSFVLPLVGEVFYCNGLGHVKRVA